MLQKCKLNFEQILKPPPESSFTPSHLQVHYGMTSPPLPRHKIFELIHSWFCEINGDMVELSGTKNTLSGTKNTLCYKNVN